MIEQESIEQLKARLDIVDVVSRYIELKKAGANYKANCPFHDEKSPSFTVSPAKQLFKCFGCGIGGDSIKFVMEYENLTYPEAIEKLASEYGVTLKRTQNSDSIYQKASILEELNNFFKKELQNNPEAKHYLLNRGVYESSIEKFEIGFAPASYKSLDFLRNRGVKLSEGLELGILAKGDDGRVYARFSNRITFPIFSPSGKIVGFGGRILTQRNDIGKYINSPQSRIFDKSTLLFGYHKAKDSIMKKGRIIIVEGNLDVVMLHQAGWRNAVATLGTALTEKVVPLIKRGDPEVIVAYDGDSAGKEAAFKAAKLLSQKEMRGGVVIFDEGMDPADMVKEGREDELKAKFNASKPFIEYALEFIVSKFDLNDALQKQKALNESLKYLHTLAPLIQDEYRDFLAILLDISTSHIKISSTKSSRLSKPIVQNQEDIAELNIIKTLLAKPQFLDEVLEYLSIDVFKTHKREFELLIGDETEDSAIIGIMVREDLKEYDKEELFEQIRFMLRRHYASLMDKLRFKKDLTLEQKSFYSRKIQDIIGRLKRGEMVRYEVFSTL